MLVGRTSLRQIASRSSRHPSIKSSNSAIFRLTGVSSDPRTLLEIQGFPPGYPLADGGISFAIQFEPFSFRVGAGMNIESRPRTSHQGSLVGFNSAEPSL